MQELGVPVTIVRSGDETYYVYEEWGDVGGVIGIPLVVPPLFVPIWVAKEDDVDCALRCLALVFDDEGILQGHKI